MTANNDLDSIQKVSMVIDALQAGILKVQKEDEGLVRQLFALPRGITGLIDISSLTPQAVSRVKAMALALTFLKDEIREEPDLATFNLQDVQCELFRLFDELFFGLTGSAAETVTSEQEIKWKILNRARNDDGHYFDQFNAAADALAEFYRRNAGAIFKIAKSLGGVKVVAGGQRSFGPSALTATRIAGLYCDTQLIPDPIFPFLSGDLHLNAMHLQLAITLYYILPLRPLIDARLQEPPVLIFPSFEESLEKNDAVTQAGISSLLIKMVAPLFGENLQSTQELLEFARKHEDTFLEVVTREKLFIPPGVEPQHVGTAREAANIYLQELKGIRNEEHIAHLERLPQGVLVLNGILERIRPHYHLLENADELEAQPMLSQNVHWYYFERCALAEARELVNEQVLSRDSLAILRSLQDDSLTWLANIPIEGLVDLRRNGEHAELREQLKKYTAQLTSAGPVEIEAVVKEVRHGLEVLVQRQKKAIEEVKAKYAPKKWTALTGAAFGMAAGASMYFMPALATICGVSAPIATAIGGLAGGGLSYAKELTGQTVEKYKTRKTLLGFLASARRTPKD